jgi:hypothetical protein
MVNEGMARAEQRELDRREAWQAMGWPAEPTRLLPHDHARITTRSNSQIFDNWGGPLSFGWYEDYR